MLTVKYESFLGVHHTEGDPGDEAGGEGDAGGHQQVPQVSLRVVVT